MQQLPMQLVPFTIAAGASAHAATQRLAAPDPAIANVGNKAWLSFARHLRC